MDTIEGIIPQSKDFVMGNEACAYGAIAAGCRFVAGYPITPSGEILNLLAKLLPRVNGVFIQMEDEIASIAACIGASWTGKKVLTATSGPGFSIMTENLGYAFMTETPMVIINTQRAGPSQGQAGKAGQGDVMQARFGSHGDYEIIALSPKNAEECFGLTIQAFNLAEQYRTPVILLSDAVIAHLRETVDFSSINKYNVIDRKRPRTPEQARRPFDPSDKDLIPPRPLLGEGNNLLVTGSTHTPDGVRETVDRIIHEQLIRRLHDKVNSNRSEIEMYEETFTDNCDILAISYGAPSRPTQGAVTRLQQEGYAIGFFRPIVLWPSPEKRMNELSYQVKRVYLVEMSIRGYRIEIERVFGSDKVHHISKLSEVHTSQEIYEEIKIDMRKHL